MTDFIRINPADNVAIALRDIKAGEEITVDGILLRTARTVPAGHKVALKDLKAGEKVIRYGFPIGHLVRDVMKGDIVDHISLKSSLEGLDDYSYEPSLRISEITQGSTATFLGYMRPDGQAGIRNDIWIIPTVGCVNGVVQKLRDLFSQEIHRYPSVEKVMAFTHDYGCSQLGEDHQNTRRILSCMLHHPNAAGVLVVGLGCENNQIDQFREFAGPVDSNRVMFMECQKIQGDEIESGLEMLRHIAAAAAVDRRTAIPAGLLKIGLKCGGSDGLSGVTANPLLGKVSDWTVSQGGSSVLTEVPEMFGAERLLMSRCRNREVFAKTVNMINGFKRYFIDNGQPIYENPSPGNKAGGISTLEEKSLGCTQKSGTSTVNDVLGYGSRIRCNGLNLLSAPGNDLVASTALAAAGCQMVLFTTGRGTPFGTFVPTVKISSNSHLAASKPGWIDFNAGVIAEGMPMDKVSGELIEFILSVASGQQTANEKSGYSSIAIFKSGVTL